MSAKAPALSAPKPKNTVSLLNSYLPAAMHVLAHYTNQMKYERPVKPLQDSPTTMAPKPG